jgi:hypothetical protein
MRLYHHGSAKLIHIDVLFQNRFRIDFQIKSISKLYEKAQKRALNASFSASNSECRN